MASNQELEEVETLAKECLQKFQLIFHFCGAGIYFLEVGGAFVGPWTPTTSEKKAELKARLRKCLAPRAEEEAKVQDRIDRLVDAYSPDSHRITAVVCVQYKDHQHIMVLNRQACSVDCPLHPEHPKRTNQ